MDPVLIGRLADELVQHGLIKSRTLERISLAAGLLAAIAIFAVGLTGVLIDGKHATTEPLPAWFIPVMGAIALLLAIATVAALLVRERRKAAVRREERERLENAADHLQEKMELASLVNSTSTSISPCSTSTSSPPSASSTASNLP